MIRVDGKGELGWALYMQAILAGPAQIEALGRRLEEFASSQSYGWSDYAIDTLVRTQSDQAARIMDDWTHRTRRDALRHRARDGVRAIAQARQITVEELIEASLGNLGFDRSGARVFDYGPRTIVVQLGADGELSFCDADGAALKAMPAARKDDDAARVKEARESVKQLKTDLKRIRRTQIRRLEEAMIAARRWLPSVWLERFADNPVMRTLASGLVWSICDAQSGELLRCFQLDDAAEPFGAQLEPVSFDDATQRIGLPHPIELGEARTIWLELLADGEQVQAFRQLERPIFDKGRIENLDAYLVKLDQVEPATFLGRLNRLGYELGPREDAGMINQSTRKVGDWDITVAHTGLAPEALSWSGDGIEVRSISADHEGKNITLDQLPSALYSEVFFDIDALMQTV